VIDGIEALQKSVKKKGAEIYERSVWQFGRERERERGGGDATVFNTRRYS